MRRVWRAGNDEAVRELADELLGSGDGAPFRSIADASRVSLLDVYLVVHRGDVSALSGNRW